MEVLTQPRKFISSNVTTQSEPFRPFAYPPARNVLPLAVVVANAKMLLKRLLSSLEAVLETFGESMSPKTHVDVRISNVAPVWELVLILSTLS
jgi:hypothetical protein